METTVGDAVFVDSNVLIYAAIRSSPFHQRARTMLAQLRDDRRPLWISRQILREYLAVLSRPQVFSSKPLSITQLVDDIHRLERLFCVAEETAECFTELLRILESVEVRGKQIHDANIVATMNVYGIKTLATHNVADFARFHDMLTVLSLE